MSLENPAVPLSAITQGDEIYEALMGEATVTASKVRVTRNKALGYSAIWRGVNLISGDVGRLPFWVYRRNKPGKEADNGHGSVRVLRRPNDFMTPFTFRQTLQAHALLDGNGYAYIVRDRDGRPTELIPLNPDAGVTFPARINGTLLYVTHIDGEPQVLPAADVLHIKGLGSDGMAGYSVIRILAETIGGALAARDYGARYFANDGRPGVVIEVPAGMSEQAVKTLRDSWERRHTGLRNAHRVALLRDGCRLSTYTANAKDAQLLENRDFDAREIANVLGVPPHKLGDASRTAYNSLESENQSYHDDTLDRWLIAWEQEWDAKLLTEGEKESDSHTFEFSRQALLRTNLSARGSYYLQAITNGWLSPDEVRGFENLNPIPGGGGATYYRPANVFPMESQTNDPAPKQPPPDPGIAA